MKHCGTQRIETDRLILREFSLDDAEAMFRNWASDPEVVKYLTWPAHADVDVSREVLKDWVSSYMQKDYYQWAIVLKENGNDPIGSMSAVKVNDDIDMRNPHSGMVMKKCGMKYEGTMRSSDRNNQGICDASWYALLRSER